MCLFASYPFLCSFLFESRAQDDGIETAVYITTEGDGCTRMRE